MKHALIAALLLVGTGFAQANINTFNTMIDLSSDADNSLKNYTEDGIKVQVLSSAETAPPQFKINEDGLILTGNSWASVTFESGLFNLSQLDIKLFSNNWAYVYGLNKDKIISHALSTNTSQKYIRFDNWDNLSSLKIESSHPISIDNLVLTPVPEPETYALMGLGLIGLITARQRNKTSKRN